MNNNMLSDTVFSLVHSYRSAMRSTLKANVVGLNGMHVRCLPFIERKKGCTANDLVTFFMRDKAQIARLIKEMIANDWVTRTANPEDKRSQLLALTEEGKELVALISATQHKVHNKMQENLTAEELATFARISAIMANNLNRKLAD